MATVASSNFPKLHLVRTAKSPRSLPKRPMVTVASSNVSQLLKASTKIVAVGLNYAAHAEELGDALPKEPVLFLKPTSSYLENGGTIEIPHISESLDHEVELAVVIGHKARHVAEATAMDFVGGYALALDMTAREIQSIARVFPGQSLRGKTPSLQSVLLRVYCSLCKMYSVLIQLLSKSMVNDPDDVELWLKVDGELRQRCSTKDMIFKIPFLISHISSLMTLFEGDVILTGTPPGIGPVKDGQMITAGITGLVDVHFNVRRRPTVCS